MNERNESTTPKKKALVLWPIYIILAVLPLVIHKYTYNPHLSSYEWFVDANEMNDYYLAWRSIIFICLICIMMGIIIYRTAVKKKPFSFSKLFIPLIAYSMLAILATIFSANRYFSTHGIIEQFEPIWVLLGYGITTYYCFNVIESIEDIHKLLKAILIGATLICLIGVFQMINIDFLDASLIKMFIGDSSFTPYSLNHKNTVYATLFNPNYVGLYVSLIFPIPLMCFLRAKTKKKKYILGCLVLALLICIFGARSKNGIIALVFSLFIMCVMFRKILFKKKKILVFGSASIIIMFIITNIISKNGLLNNIKNVFATNDNSPNLTKIVTDTDGIKIDYKGISLNISMITQDGSCQFICYDNNGNLITTQLSEDSKSVILTDERFGTIYLEPFVKGDLVAFNVIIDGVKWCFTNQTDGTYYFFNPYNRLLKVNLESSYKKSWSIASGRGYIWDKTIPIIKNNFWLGTGPDTFLLQFPNQDYLNGSNAGFHEELISKPHNLYLQIASQTGVPSLIAFLVFYIWYFISTLKLCGKGDFSSDKEMLSVSIMLGTLGYMVAGLAYDSTITVTPIFWALIGISLGINKLIKRDLTIDCMK